ncbi:hypothetical protein WAF17_16620 [Bernardetia sp. ABR2-2B]|uniref:hypothetical protein n=1 Tax=Bernardetia sp. ABR2-2B TaxID=3127472 RepID=UPI0030CF2ECD
MLTRELKSTFNKSLNEFKVFVVAQTERGNSYTTQIASNSDYAEYKRLSRDILSVLLSDNNLPQEMIKDCLITGIKFNEQTDKQTGELVQTVQFILHHFVEKMEKKGKLIYNYLKIPLTNREYISLPDRTVRQIGELQEFLNRIAIRSFEAEPIQTVLFNTTTKSKNEDTLDFDLLNQATEEITGSAAPQEHVEGMKAATEERLKERNKENNQLGIPVEITEED